MEYRICKECGKEIKTLGTKYCAECANFAYCKNRTKHKKVKYCSECGTQLNHGNEKICEKCRSDSILISFINNERLSGADSSWLGRSRYSGLHDFVCDHIDELKSIVDYCKRKNLKAE